VHFVTKWTIASCRFVSRRVAQEEKKKKKKKKQDTFPLPCYYSLMNGRSSRRISVWRLRGQDRKASREKETVLLDKNLISSLNVFNIGPARPDPVDKVLRLTIFISLPPPSLSPFRFFSCLLLCVFFLFGRDQSLPSVCLSHALSRVCVCLSWD